MLINSVEFTFFFIFTGAAVLATIALYARQTVIVAYIILGMISGPWGLALVSNTDFIEGASKVGITFLLYLLGLDLLPQQLLKMLRSALMVTLFSTFVFFISGFLVAYFFGYTLLESILIGTVVIFSSTIIGLKLLPTTALHHRHIGQIIISVLLIQDLLAIIVLLLLQGYSKGGTLLVDIGLQLFYLPLLISFCYLLNRLVIVRLIQRFDQFHEYIFLLTISWCLGIAELSSYIGLSHEIGAFVAGVTLASNPVALFITERLKPLRDFFLIIFFFALGTQFNISTIGDIIVPAAALTAVTLIVKPLVFKYLLLATGEKKGISMEIGIRLGQVSEFSLLIAMLAVSTGVIGMEVFFLIQLTTLISFIFSSYWTVLKYPTPIAISDKLRQD